MGIYIIAFTITIVLGFLHKNNKVSKKCFCWITGITYFCISAFRHHTVGADTGTYQNWFYRVAGNSPLEVIQEEKVDPIFGMFMSLVSIIIRDYTFFLTLVALLFVVSVWYLIFKYSKDPCLSILILLAFNIYQFSLTGIRQTIAMSIVSLSYVAYLNERKKTSYILVVLGSAFHKSALITFLWYIVKKVINSFSRRNTVFLLFVLITIFAIFRNYVTLLFSPLIEERGYVISETGGGEMMALVIIALYLFCLFTIRSRKICNQQIIYFYMVFPSLIFEMLVPLQNVFFRLAFYFLIMISILIPSCIYNLKTLRLRSVVSTSLYLLFSCIYLFFTIRSAHIVPYKFFWE